MKFVEAMKQFKLNILIMFLSVIKGNKWLDCVNFNVGMQSEFYKLIWFKPFVTINASGLCIPILV